MDQITQRSKLQKPADWLTKLMKEKGWDNLNYLPASKKKRPPKPLTQSKKLPSLNSSQQTIKNYFPTEALGNSINQSLSKSVLKNEVSTEIGTCCQGQDSITFNNFSRIPQKYSVENEKIAQKGVKPASLDKDFVITANLRKNSDEFTKTDRKTMVLGKRGYNQLKSEEMEFNEQKPSTKNFVNILKSDLDFTDEFLTKFPQIKKKEDFLTEAQNLQSKFECSEARLAIKFNDNQHAQNTSDNFLGLDYQSIKQEQLDDPSQKSLNQSIKKDPASYFNFPGALTPNQNQTLNSEDNAILNEYESAYKKIKNNDESDNRSQSFMSMSYSGVTVPKKDISMQNQKIHENLECVDNKISTIPVGVKSELEYNTRITLGLKSEEFFVGIEKDMAIGNIVHDGSFVGIKELPEIAGVGFVKQDDTDEPPTTIINANTSSMPVGQSTPTIYENLKIEKTAEETKRPPLRKTSKKLKPSKKSRMAKSSKTAKQSLKTASDVAVQKGSIQLQTTPETKSIEDEITEFDLIEQKFLEKNKKFCNYSFYKEMDKDSLTEQYYAHSKEINYDLMMNENFNNNMRILLFDWMSEVAHDFEMARTTFHKSLKLLDKYLSMKQIAKEQLQLYGAVCLSLAVKIDEVYCPYQKDFVKAGGSCFTEEEIEIGEIDLCQTLDWNIGSTSLAEIANYILVKWDRYITKGLEVFLNHNSKNGKKDVYGVFKEYVGVDSGSDDEANDILYNSQLSTKDTNQSKRRLRSNKANGASSKGPINMNEDKDFDINFLKQKYHNKAGKGELKLKSLEKFLMSNGLNLRHPNKESYKFYCQFVFLIDLLVYNPLYFNHNPIELLASCLYITLKKHVNPNLLFTNKLSENPENPDFSQTNEQNQKVQRKTSDLSLFNNFIDKTNIDADTDLYFPQNKFGLYTSMLEDVNVCCNMTSDISGYKNSFYMLEDSDEDQKNIEFYNNGDKPLASNTPNMENTQAAFNKIYQRKIEEPSPQIDKKANVKLEQNSSFQKMKNEELSEREDCPKNDPVTLKSMKVETGCDIRVKSECFREDVKSQVKMPIPSLLEEELDKVQTKKRKFGELEAIDVLFENFVAKVLGLDFLKIQKLSDLSLVKFAKEVEYSRYPVAVERDKSKFNKVVF